MHVVPEEHYNDRHINVGSGEEISIKDLALLVKKITGFEGEIIFNTSMPDGTPRKLMDSSRINSLGWKPAIPLEVGIRQILKTHELERLF